MLKKQLNRYHAFPVQVKASIWFLLCSFLQKGISFLATPIFTRLLTTAEYGQFNVFQSWHGIISIIVTLNLAYGVYTQGLIKFDKDRAVISSSLQGLTLLLCSFWAIVYFLTRGLWNRLFHLSTVQMLSMFLMTWTTAVYSFWAASERVQYRYKKLVLLTLLVSAAKPVIEILLVRSAADKVTARVIGIVAAELAGYAWLFFVQLRKGKVFFSRQYWRYAILFNLPLLLHYLSQTVLSSSDRIMIERMVGDSAAGIYGLGYSVAGIMLIFNTALSQTMSPWMYQRIKDHCAGEIEHIAFICIMIIAGANLLLILIAPEAVKLFAPPSYYDAVWTIPPDAMSCLFLFSYDLFAKFEFYYEKTHYIMIASLGGAILNIALNAVFIRAFGYIAAAYTTLACYMIYSFAHYCMMNRVCRNYLNGIRPFSLKKLLLIYGAFLFVGFIFVLTYPYSWIRYGLIVLSALIAFIYRKKLASVASMFLKIRKAKR